MTTGVAVPPLGDKTELLVLSLSGIEVAPAAAEDVWSFAGTEEAAFPRELPMLLSRLDPDAVAEPPWLALLDDTALLPDAGAGVASANGVTADIGVAMIGPLAVVAPEFNEKPYPGGTP